MIKINLLPKSIYEKKALINTAIVFGVLFVAIVAGCLTFTMMKRQQVAALEAKGTEAAGVQAQIDQTNADAEKIRGEIGPIQQKLKFIADVHLYNAAWPALCEQIAKWTYEKVHYTSLQFTNGGQGVSIQMEVKTLDDLGRYLINMYSATDLFTSVSISGLPGYPAQAANQAPDMGAMPAGAMEMPSGGGAGLQAIEAGVVSKPSAGWFTVQVDCVLKNPIPTPAPAGGAAGAPTGAAPGVAAAAPPMPPSGAMEAPGSMPAPGGGRPVPGM